MLSAKRWIFGLVELCLFCCLLISVRLCLLPLSSRTGDGVKIGYARVSTRDQDLAYQVDALKAAGCDKIFREKASGANKDRPQLAAALDYLRPGDTLVVWKLDRLGRTTRGLLDLAELLRSKGAEFASLTDSIDTGTSAGRVVFTLLAAFAEMERDLIRERTRAGLAVARARGRTGGRKGLDPDKVASLQTLAKDRTRTTASICKALGISRSTFYKYAPSSGV